jgi:hypothetical protein
MDIEEHITVEVVLPETDDVYRVDVVRWSVAESGIEHQQRLTLAQYASWGEAQEHRVETLEALHEQGVSALQDDWERLKSQPAVALLDSESADVEVSVLTPREEIAKWLEFDLNPDTDALTSNPTSPYWQLTSLPVATPEGEALGYALHLWVYPGLENQPETLPDIPEGEPFQWLEMGHFKTREAADRFGEEFKGYLMPDVLEAPELAVCVASLEGLPEHWQSFEEKDLQALQTGTLTLIRDPQAWHVYNPFAEQEARIQSEGWYSDPLMNIQTDSTEIDF